MSVVKQLRKDGIASLFTNPFLQNMKGKFEKCLDRFSTEIEREPNARRHIVMILLGYLNFKVSENDKAIRWFEEVLKEDATSINALLNLIFAYEQMKLPSKAEEYEKKIQDILSNDSLGERSKAYAKYELAGIMSAVNAQLQPGGTPEAQSLFREAIHCKEVPEHNKLEWLFAYAYFCFNTDNMYGQTQHQHFHESMETLYRIVTSKQPSLSEDEDKSTQEELRKDVVSKAWCFMGSLLSRYNRGFKGDGEPKQLKDVIECPKGFSDCTLQSCMEKANEKATKVNTPVIMRRTGLVYMDMGSMAEAEGYLEKAVNLDGENGYGHYLLGLLNLKKCVYVCEQENSAEKTDLLNKSIDCFKVAIVKGFNLWYCFRELAKAHFLKGGYNDAIGRCQQSEEHGGNLDSELYELWAMIYADMHNPRSAKEMHSKAQKLARGQYDDEEHDFGVIYHDDDIDQISTVVTDLEKQLHVRCFLLGRDILCGENTVEAWNTLGKSCQCILVFCSDTFFTGTSVSFRILTSIINDRCIRGEGSTIIPVKLPGCKDIPSVLKPCRAIEVDWSGKFIEEIKRKVESFPLRGKRD